MRLKTICLARAVEILNTCPISLKVQPLLSLHSNINRRRIPAPHPNSCAFPCIIYTSRNIGPKSIAPSLA